MVHEPYQNFYFLTVCFPHLFNKCAGKIALNGGAWWPKISKRSPEKSKFQTMEFVLCRMVWVNIINDDPCERLTIHPIIFPKDS